MTVTVMEVVLLGLLACVMLGCMTGIVSGVFLLIRDSWRGKRGSK